jgi:hypothetical protein
MEKNELYSIIFKRKSIRNYDLTSLNKNILTEISNHFQSLKHMYDDIKIELKIISPDMVKRRVMKKAPHYIAVFSESKDGYLTNVGFMLQQWICSSQHVVLALAGRGFLSLLKNC